MLLKNENYKLDWADEGASGSDRVRGLAKFRLSFETLYQESQIKAVLVFLEYVAANGIDEVAKAMAWWVLEGTLYLSVILDQSSLDSELALEFLSIETACQILPKLREADPQFCSNFMNLVSGLSKQDVILRALQLTPALGDYSFLISWLRALDQNTDAKIRSRAAKLLCQLRPTRGMIERQMQSRDPRIRADAVEALWRDGCLHSEDDALNLLRTALDDGHHRVVANALVGLHQFGDTSAVERMVELSGSKQQLVRAAMAWALGMVSDSRALAALQVLAKDRSFTVRRRAETTLQSLQALSQCSEGK